MTLLIYLTSALIVLSKFLDCYTTSAHLVSIQQESNPLARLLMNRLGGRFTIWAIFVLALGIVGISTWSLFCCYTGIGHRLGYIGIGLFIAWVQFSVAHTNKTKRTNLVMYIPDPTDPSFRRELTPLILDVNSTIEKN